MFLLLQCLCVNAAHRSSIMRGTWSLNPFPVLCCPNCFEINVKHKKKKAMISILMFIYHCLTGSRQSWGMTFWRSMTGQTSCLLWSAPLTVPRCPSSCSAAATSCICCLLPITADQMLDSKYYMKVSQERKLHVYA